MSARRLGLVVLLSLLPAGTGWGAERPNVLLIAIDDLNDWVGCLGGHPQALTPNIDRLASRGMLFTNAHCQGPICGPSRTSLLTGLYPHTTGVYQQPTAKILRDDTRFVQGHQFPEYFGAQGYRTHGVGKIAHNYPQEMLFQDAGDKGGSGPKPPNPNTNRFHWHLPPGPYSGTQTDWGAFPDRDEEMPDFQTASWAIERLQQRDEKPFLLAVGFHRPHVPFYVPQKWFDLFPLESVEVPEVRGDDLDDVPAIGRAVHEMPKYPNLAWLQENDNDEFRRCVQAYLACVAFVDDQVGRVLDALEASPYADNTMIVLFSDHGYHLGEKDRVSKHGLWEESTRVVLMVVRPGESNPRQSDQPVGLIDLYPTLVEMCGLPAVASNEGMSLVPLLEGKESPWRRSVLTTYARGNHTLRSRQHRYIRYDDGSEELYDLASDPQCFTNLAGRQEEAKRIADFRTQLPTAEAPYHPSTSPEPVNAWFEEHLKKNGVR